MSQNSGHPYGKKTSWLHSEERNCIQLPRMSNYEVTEDILMAIIKKLHNWKSPGAGQIQNFWFKQFNTFHSKLLYLLNEALTDPSKFPTSLIVGRTYLLPKGNGFGGNPANARPKTCLSSLYKIMAACLNTIIGQHLQTNKIIYEEQNGCAKGSKGCKE